MDDEQCKELCVELIRFGILARRFLWEMGLQRWSRLGDGVQYCHCGDGLYIVRESDGRNPDSPPSFAFYRAKNVNDLRTQYYGGDYEY